MNRLLPKRRGLTLLELILALSLSVIIVFAIGMAIHLNLRVLESRRAEIEKTQLARAILQLMASDLRSAVQYVTLDFDSVDALAGAEALAALGDVSEGEVPLEDESVEDVATTEEETVTSTGGDVVASTTPGLIGYQYELHVDVSRLPRPDQYEAAMSSSSANSVNTDVLSDVKTVSYYLQSPDGSSVGSPPASLSSGPSLGQNTMGLNDGTGLVRRELDRAVTAYAMELGDMTSLQQSGQIVAAEVSHIEFLYFDGIDWLTQWDSEVSKSLPLAVDIRMLLRMADQRTPDLMSTRMQSEPLVDETWYRMVVHLPAADPLSEEELAAAEEEDAVEDEEADDSTGQSSSGASMGSSPSATTPTPGSGL